MLGSEREAALETMPQFSFTRQVAAETSKRLETLEQQYKVDQRMRKVCRVGVDRDHSAFIVFVPKFTSQAHMFPLFRQERGMLLDVLTHLYKAGLVKDAVCLPHSPVAS